MLTFNHLLENAEIDPRQVYLVRHQHSGLTTPYEAWLARDGSFEEYQSFQARVKFKTGSFVAAFVVPPSQDTLFAGLYSVDESQISKKAFTCPISGVKLARGKGFRYRMKKLKVLDEYEGKLVVDWGPGFRSWVQRAHSQPKPIAEIRRVFQEPSFPGFDLFSVDLDDMETLPFAWREILRAVNGVYLITCKRTGQHYIGSAYGSEGIYGRWMAYYKDGHGNNLKMKKLGHRDLRFTVLEVLSPTLSEDQVIAMENRWKEKLLTREFGLNAN